MRSKVVKSPNRLSKHNNSNSCYNFSTLLCFAVFVISSVIWLRTFDTNYFVEVAVNDGTLRGRPNPYQNSKILQKTNPQRRRIAFAITITKDGSFQDGAAVLAYSLYNSNMTKEFAISLVAFVHPNVTTSRPILNRLGYHVIEVQTPINTTAIQFEFLRTKINKNGCCGAAELIKLNSYRLTQYEVVVHMDADTFVAHSFGELFDIDKSLIYTTDPAMATFKMDYKMPAQGGFLVMKPSVKDYEALINIMLTTEFVIHRGWNATEVGWFWGGMTVQGILPYYYNIISAPNRALKINRCVYNTMADTPECQVQSLADVKSVHFTATCQKPWDHCGHHHQVRLCQVLIDEWYRLRQATESFYNIRSHESPCTPSNHYIRMKNLVNAILPPGIFVPDDSPNELFPIGNSGFTSLEAAKRVKWN